MTEWTERSEHVRTFSSSRELIDAAGEALGTTDWRTVTQAQIDAFADIVDDHQWIHVDTELATDGPFGGTIVHGMLTLSLVPTLIGELIDLPFLDHGLNYGFDRVRFINPLRSGARVRAHVEIMKAEGIDGGARVVFRAKLEVENAAKPICVADNLIVFFD